MAGAKHDRRSTSIHSLRSQLENMQEAETSVPTHPSPKAAVVPAPVEDGPRPSAAGEEAKGRRMLPLSPRQSTGTRRSESGRVTFSEEVRARDPEHQEHLRLNTTDLYPIESRVEDTDAARRWGERQTWQGDLPGERNEGLEGREVETQPSNRVSRVSFAEPPTITRHGHWQTRLGGAEDSIRRAAQASTTIAHTKDWVARQKARTRRVRRSRSGRLRARAAALYKRWILEGLLRQRPLPPSADGRRIPLTLGVSRRKDGLIDERRGKPYISNFIRSSRYTIWSFLPKQLFFQFSRLANAYFLTISILQMIPGLSTTGTYTTIGPLIAFVALSMAKEGWDDYRRYTMDKSENRTETWVLDPDASISRQRRHGVRREKFRGRRKSVGSEMQALDEPNERQDEPPPWSPDEDVPWSKTQWQGIRVGDVIKLRRDQNVPADIVLLHATGPNGVAYIETMALDGETNLKSKQACPLFTEHCGSLSALETCEAEIVSEDPNLDLYNYTGKAVVKGETMPLTLNQVVYRGSTLRNTNEAIGLVINTGEECKIRMNANRNVRAKAPAMQAKLNKIIILLVFFVLLLSTGCLIGNMLWVRDTRTNAWYLHHYVLSYGRIFIGFVIVFNTLIPLSLYVSLEIVKLGQLMLLRDIDMYDLNTNTPMVANTTTILEDLGQVSYVFSDKTGTLTENMMRFRKLSVAGTAWLHDMDIRREHDKRGRQGGQMSGFDVGNSNGKGKGKQAVRASTSSTRTSTTSVPRRSNSIWTSTAESDHGQPQLRTDDLLEYIRQRPNTPFSTKFRQLILCIALCHTCLPEKKADGSVEFQAASPDELALVEAAQDLGVLLVDRTAQSIKLHSADETGSPSEETYEVLDVIEFSSKRKRMSIVIRMPNGRICVLSKGADSVILPRLKLDKLAMETASVVDRQASIRRSMEQEKALRKLSMHSTRNSTARNSTTLARIFNRKSFSKRSASMKRGSLLANEDDSSSLHSGRGAAAEVQGSQQIHRSPRISVSRGPSMDLLLSPVAMDDPYDGMVDESAAVSDSMVFERCFQHLDEFANEGLRTLLYCYRYVGEDEYRQWKTIYHEATTSLVDRQARIEAAAELIEQNFDLAGATAIEDKLQEGVPETIDKLRRANIKVWMLTGDKRETAINIAHSARICKPFSEIYILDATTEGSLQEKLAATLVDVGRGMVPHSVVVIDGHTLGVVEDDDTLKVLFFDLVARVESVICCRASPAQKATLVKCIRDQVPSSLTLAIGDGANDIAMIQASHVGIGISGREGLQAARISDYSIAQFRFLQKLLFVHGRWNYIRTGKYVLGTFWKEIVFYLVQALYQRHNGYTGTSLYESASLAVFNTLFTSLAVILPGIFEQDLTAETLLAMPELYTFGQRSKAFNFRKYVGWMTMAVLEAVLIFFGIWGIYTRLTFDRDNGLFAMGTLAFTACVLFINIKLLVLELHNKTLVIFIGFFISVAGWFLWCLFLAAIYKNKIGPYTVKYAFVRNFGRMPVWWLALVMVLAAVMVVELSVTALRRIFWPQDQDLMQEAERLGRRAEVDAIEFGEDEGGDDAPGEGLQQQRLRKGLSDSLRRLGRRPSQKVSGDVYTTIHDHRASVNMQGKSNKKQSVTTSVSEVSGAAEFEMQ